MTDLIEKVDLPSEPAPVCVHEDGYVNDRGEKFVWEYDKDGNATGWHKEWAEGFSDPDRDGD